ncbi:MAG: glycine zipper domain-containing protein [Pirellulales bacterium]
MASRAFPFAIAIASIVALAVGCQSPYYADRGAAAGGLLGAGAGAIIGNQTGDPLAGAAIGAGLGALGGGVFGSQMDEAAARNRAEIAAHMGRQVASGAATPDEVVAMTKAGVDPRMIANYVQTSGMARPLAANDIIYLHQQGVATEVIQAMHAPPAAPVQMVQGLPPGPPVIVEEHYYGPPVIYGPPRYYHHHHCGPRVGWGVSVHR